MYQTLNLKEEKEVKKWTYFKISTSWSCLIIAK